MELVLGGIVSTGECVHVLQSVELVAVSVGDGADVVQRVELVLGLRVREHGAVRHGEEGEGEVGPGQGDFLRGWCCDSRGEAGISQRFSKCLAFTATQNPPT